MADASKTLLRPDLAERADRQPLPGAGPHLEAVISLGKLWPNGSPLRVRFLGGSQAQRDAGDGAGRAGGREHANLRFVASNDPDAEIRVAFDPSDGAWSYLGTDCSRIPRNQPTMNLGFQDGGTSATSSATRSASAMSTRTPKAASNGTRPR